MIDLPHIVIGTSAIEYVEQAHSNWVNGVQEIITCGGQYPERLTGSNPTRLVDLFYIMERLDLQPTDRILEVGAWDTFACAYTATHCQYVTVSDSLAWGDRGYRLGLNPPTKTWQDAINSISGVNFAQMEIEKLTSYGQQFDKIYSISVVEHVLNDLQGFKEIYECLKPGGIFVFSTEINLFTPKNYPVGIEANFRVYQPEQLINLGREAGFTVTDNILLPTLDDSVYQTMLSRRSPGEFFTAGIFTFRKV